MRPSHWAAETYDTCDIAVRGQVLRACVRNLRLRSWADNFERLEPELLDWIDTFPPDAVFYDLGASIGLFSLYAGFRGAKVYAFEPEAQNFGTLELNHFLNNETLQQPLHSFNVALSDETAVDWIHCRFYGAGEHVKIVACLSG